MVNRLLVGAPALVALLAGCSSEISTDRGAIARLDAAMPASRDSLAPAASAAELTATRVPAPETLDLTTVLYSEHDAELTARRRGVIAAIKAELGDRVEKGEELARLDDGQEQAAFDAANAARELARSEYERISQLAKQSIVPPADLESATFRLRSAEATLSDAGVKLEYTRIRTPFSGAVTRRFIRVGQTVDEGDALFRTTSLRPLRALVRVPELSISGFTIGRSVTLDGLTGERVSGRILRISPAVDPASGTIEVLVDVPDPGRLRPGSAVRIELTERSR
jgi:RND family efflux transporter MFP subunit